MMQQSAVYSLGIVVALALGFGLYVGMGWLDLSLDAREMQTIDLAQIESHGGGNLRFVQTTGVALRNFAVLERRFGAGDEARAIYYPLISAQMARKFFVTDRQQSKIVAVVRVVEPSAQLVQQLREPEGLKRLQLMQLETIKGVVRSGWSDLPKEIRQKFTDARLVFREDAIVIEADSVPPELTHAVLLVAGCATGLVVLLALWLWWLRRRRRPRQPVVNED